METAQTNLPAPAFIRSPNFSVGPAPAPVAVVPIPAAPIPVAAVVANPSKKNGITQFFSSSKNRMIVVAVVLLIALGIGLFLIHRSYQRRQRKVDEDEAAQEALAAGQQQRTAPPTQMAPSGAGGSMPPMVAPPPGSQMSDYDRQMSMSQHEDQRRLQDMQFRQFQQHQMASGAGQMPPEFAHTSQPPSSPPGTMPNLGVNPSAGSGMPGQPPIPGSPDDLGFTPI